MALIKQNAQVPFALGLDQKTDPYQIMPGKFFSLVNKVFTKDKRLDKRNGFAPLSAPANGSSPFPTPVFTTLSTFKANLIALGNYLSPYSTALKSFVFASKQFQTAALSTLSLVRSSTNQSQADSALSNGFVCTAYTDNVPSGGMNTLVYKYIVADATTGQVFAGPTTLSTAIFAPRVFALGSFFVVLFATAGNHLQYIAISTASLAASAAKDISTLYSAAATGTVDGVVASNGNLYLAWNATDAGGAVRVAYLTPTLTQSNTVTLATTAAYISVTSDNTTAASPVIWVTTVDGGAGYSFALDKNLNVTLGSTQTIFEAAVNVASVAPNLPGTGTLQIFYEVAHNYSYDGAIPSNYIKSVTCSNAGAVFNLGVIVQSVGLASKAFLFQGFPYFLTAYKSPYQPTYFLVAGQTNNVGAGVVIAKLAYSNAGGYVTTGLPTVTVSGSSAYVPYLFADLVQAGQKSLTPTGQPTPVYSQLGVNLASFTFNVSSIVSSEIGNNLHVTGGFPWMYDGNSPVEHNFFVWPDSIKVTTSAAGGLLSDQKYFYQVTYEWTDAQGNVHRSAPSIPVSITTAGGGTSSNTINIPTLRLTYKQATTVRLVIYRWSTAQPIFYQTTSILIPTLNTTAADSIAYVDTLADGSIDGNNILYTTGGVVENIQAPATNAVTLWKARLWLIDAEDPDLLWYSKQVVETVPVETSDLFTFYVPPTVGAETGTGPNRCIFAMDDKLILFKANALYYLVGDGPDITGANNDYTQPNFITSTLGSVNQQSIVFTPQGLMFQASLGRGIWLLGRDLSTSYIGSPVENSNAANVLSAIQVPGTTQVRFTMSDGTTLMYDWFFAQWGTFQGIPGVSSTVYNGLHTYIDSRGNLFQETPGLYLDNGHPVLFSFTTAWFNLSGLQAFQRAYYFYILGTYLSPHFLNVGIAYDYNPAEIQQSQIVPVNGTGVWGSDPLYGDSDIWGGPGNVEQWRVFLTRQKCQAFQITVQEQYDPSSGVQAGAGCTLSGLNLVYGTKKGYPSRNPALSVG